MATTPTINGQTFAQASAGISDRVQLGELATQYQNAGSTTVPNSSPITSANLAPNAPLKLSRGTTPTYGGVGGAVDALVTQTKTADQQALDTLKQNSDTSLNDLLKATLDQGNISSSVDRTAQNAAKQQSDIYTSQLEQEQLANRRAVESINNNAGITTAAQRDAEAADVNRKSLSKQADIAILQTAANRNYDTAASIADRQVALKLEQGTARVNALKYFYENNKEAFTKAEDRAYQEKIKKEDAALKKQETNENLLKDIKLNVAQSDAPNKAQMLQQLSEIDTKSGDATDAAIKIAGIYSGDYLKAQLLKEQIKTEKAQRDNIYSTIAARKSDTARQDAAATLPGVGKPLTDAQIQYAGYADRIQQANSIIDERASTFANMNYAQFKLASSTSQLANSLLTPDQRQAAQAMQNFITAKLRKESGASISPSEFDTARLQYFPALGDDPGTLAQKKALRDSVLQNNVLGAGSAYTPQQSTVSTQPNPFQQAIGQTNQTFNTNNMTVTPSGSFDWTLPGSNTKK